MNEWVGIHLRERFEAGIMKELRADGDGLLELFRQSHQWLCLVCIRCRDVDLDTIQMIITEVCCSISKGAAAGGSYDRPFTMVHMPCHQMARCPGADTTPLIPFNVWSATCIPSV